MAASRPREPQLRTRTTRLMTVILWGEGIGVGVFDLPTSLLLLPHPKSHHSPPPTSGAWKVRIRDRVDWGGGPVVGDVKLNMWPCPGGGGLRRALESRIPAQLCPRFLLGLWGATAHCWAPFPGFEFYRTPLFPSTVPDSPRTWSAAHLPRLFLPGMETTPGLKSPPGFSLGMGFEGSALESDQQARKPPGGPKPKV